MKPSELKLLLAHSIANNFPVLIKGRPGIGKTDIVQEATLQANADLIMAHPVVSDPTDFKGLPYASNGEANFLPYGDLKRLVGAQKRTVYFLDDLGQAPASVQAACMQLILARQVNGHSVSPYVTFIAATNRKEDKAAVSGILEPVKSRFMAIVELDVNHNDWVSWALGPGNMPITLVAFIRFRPSILDDFKPTKDIINSASPRTIAAVGKWQNSNLPASLYGEVFTGAAGEAFAAEYMAFLKIYNDLPNIDQILLSPHNARVPTEPAVLYAIGGAIASKINDVNAANAFAYIARLPIENSYACIKDAITKNPSITNTKSYIEWASDKANIIFS